MKKLILATLLTLLFIIPAHADKTLRWSNTQGQFVEEHIVNKKGFHWEVIYNSNKWKAEDVEKWLVNHKKGVF